MINVKEIMDAYLATPSQEERSYLSPEEIQKLSSALVEISDEIKTAVLKIAS